MATIVLLIIVIIIMFHDPVSLFSSLMQNNYLSILPTVLGTMNNKISLK